MRCFIKSVNLTDNAMHVYFHGSFGRLSWTFTLAVPAERTGVCDWLRICYATGRPVQLRFVDESNTVLERCWVELYADDWEESFAVLLDLG